MARQSSARPVRGRVSRGRQPRRETMRRDQVPEVYREMLEEAEARDPEQFHSDRPIKRRRVGDTKAIPVDSPSLEPTSTPVPTEEEYARQVQTVYDSATSDESDIEWEDVDLEQPAPKPSIAPLAFQENNKTLQITLDQESERRRKTVRRRKPLTAAEKKLRLDAHKAHLLCLLAHVHLRNRWCNDEGLQVRVGLLEIVFPVSNLHLELFETNVAQKNHCAVESR